MVAYQRPSQRASAERDSCLLRAVTIHGAGDHDVRSTVRPAASSERAGLVP